MGAEGRKPLLGCFLLDVCIFMGQAGKSAMPSLYHRTGMLKKKRPSRIPEIRAALFGFIVRLQLYRGDVA